MNLRKYIDVPVFVYTDEEISIEELGLDLSEDAGLNETEDRRFWTIDSVFKNRKDPEYSSFYSGGVSFVTPYSMKKMTELIEGALNG
jgi:hypothetical protein